MNTSTLRQVVIFASGILFALGLGLSGMTQPEKVKGFLDFAGKWDPTLLTVIGAATGLNLILFRFILRRKQPILATSFSLPTRKDLDTPLLLGSALFGIGWGIGGFCPGPAITSLASGTLTVLIFVVAMLGGSAAYLSFENWQKGQKEAKAAANPQKSA